MTLPTECISEACRDARAAELAAYKQPGAATAIVNPAFVHALDEGRGLDHAARVELVRQARDARLAAIARIEAQRVRPVSMSVEEERETLRLPPGTALAAYRCDRCGQRWIHAASSARRPPAVVIRTADTDKRPDDRELAESIARAGLGR